MRGHTNDSSAGSNNNQGNANISYNNIRQNNPTNNQPNFASKSMDSNKLEYGMRSNSLVSNNASDDAKRKHEVSARKFQKIIDDNREEREEKNSARTFNDDFEENLQNLSIFTEKAKKRLSTPDKSRNNDRKLKNNLILSKSNNDLNLSAMNNAFLKNKKKNIEDQEYSDDLTPPQSFHDNFAVDIGRGNDYHIHIFILLVLHSC
jgi:hypothetical protein